MTLAIGERSTHPVNNIAEASRIYERERDASGEGVSTFPRGEITGKDGEWVGRVSYNGRVWAERREDWNRDTGPIYCPTAGHRFIIL